MIPLPLASRTLMRGTNACRPAKFDAAHAGHFEVGHDKIIVARGGGEGA